MKLKVQAFLSIESPNQIAVVYTYAMYYIRVWNLVYE
jgi:hypothetical protein